MTLYSMCISGLNLQNYFEKVFIFSQKRILRKSSYISGNETFFRKKFFLYFGKWNFLALRTFGARKKTHSEKISDIS